MGLMSADSITAWATVALGVVTLLSLGFGYTTLAATRQAIEESRRSRIDEHAPRVVISSSPPPVWPPCLAQSVMTPARHDMPSEMRFDLPGHANREIRLTAYFLLQNEGQSSAFVTLPVGGYAVGDLDGRPPEEGEDVMRWSERNRLVVRIGPGEVQWVLVEAGHTVSRWAELAVRFAGSIAEFDSDSLDPDLDVPGVRAVFDVSDQGKQLRDRLVVDILCIPVIAVPQATDAWMGRASYNQRFSEVARVAVVGSARAYPGSAQRREGRASKSNRRYALTDRSHASS